MALKQNKIWFSSDSHFCHDRGFIYEPRGFSTVDEANEEIIKRWNSVVGPNDLVYHLGDVMLNDNEKGIQCLERLNGQIYILRGNHDTSTRMYMYLAAKNVFGCGDYAKVIKHNGYNFYISHYPTLTSNMDNDAPTKKHMINLYGHTHQKTNFYQDQPFMYHVGLDSHNCYPVEITQIINDIEAEVTRCRSML